MCLGGGIGRRKGLKIPRLLVGVRVQFPPQAPYLSSDSGPAVSCALVLSLPKEILMPGLSRHNVCDGGWCGEGELNAPLYPIGLCLFHFVQRTAIGSNLFPEN
jgi:hypothetical protein